MRTTFFLFVVGVALGVSLLSCKRDPGRGLPIPEAKAADTSPPLTPAIPPAIRTSVREKGQAIAAQAFGFRRTPLGGTMENIKLRT